LLQPFLPTTLPSPLSFNPANDVTGVSVDLSALTSPGIVNGSPDTVPGIPGPSAYGYGIGGATPAYTPTQYAPGTDTNGIPSQLLQPFLPSNAPTILPRPGSGTNGTPTQGLQPNGTVTGGPVSLDNPVIVSPSASPSHSSAPAPDLSYLGPVDANGLLIAPTTDVTPTSGSPTPIDYQLNGTDPGTGYTPTSGSPTPMDYQSTAAATAPGLSYLGTVDANGLLIGPGADLGTAPAIDYAQAYQYGDGNAPGVSGFASVTVDTANTSVIDLANVTFPGATTDLSSLGLPADFLSAPLPSMDFSLGSGSLPTNSFTGINLGAPSGSIPGINLSLGASSSNPGVSLGAPSGSIPGINLNPGASSSSPGLSLGSGSSSGVGVSIGAPSGSTPGAGLGSGSSPSASSGGVSVSVSSGSSNSNPVAGISLGGSSPSSSSSVSSGSGTGTAAAYVHPPKYDYRGNHTQLRRRSERVMKGRSPTTGSTAYRRQITNGQTSTFRAALAA